MKLMKALSLKRNSQSDLDKAKAAFEAGDLETADTCYQRAGEQPENVFWCNFYRGRIASRRNDPENALLFFEKARAEDPKSFWCNYEILTVLVQDDEHHHDVIDTAKVLMSAELPPDLSSEHWQRIEALSHKVFEGAHRGVGAQLLSMVYVHTKQDILTELGLVRIVEEGSDAELRIEVADLLRKRPERSQIADRVLRQYFEETGQHVDLGQVQAPAVEEIEKTPDDLPKNFGDYLNAIKTAIGQQDAEQIKYLRANSDRFPYRQQLFLNIVVEIEMPRPKAAATHFLEHVRLFADAPKFPGIRLAYQLLDMGEMELAKTVLVVLWTYHPDDPDVALAITAQLIRLGHFAEAGSFFEKYLEPVSDKSDAIWNVKSELLLANGDLDGALEILKRYDDREQRPRGVLNSLIRIAAEQKEWNKVYDLTAANVTKDDGFAGILDPMVRAARKTGREREAFDLLNSLDLENLGPHRFFSQALFEDLVLAGDPDMLELLDTIDLPPARRSRINALLQGQRDTAAEAPTGETCIYFCADETYLDPALTSLTSLVMSNMTLSKTCRFSVIVEKDLMKRAKSEIKPIKTALKVKIDVIDAATLIPKEDKLRTNYGMPTGGHALTEAAYYRIFYALKLAQMGDVDKALYIDADTLVRPGIFDVFNSDEEAPIAARPEVSRPEIARAANEHKLDHDYFNSGVLLFDFSHPDTLACLEASVAAAVDPETKLFFHDQCALNIGFNGKTRPLDNKYNYFLAPETTFSDTGQDAVIVHYLDRPKPWDSLYRRKPDEWLAWWQIRRNLMA